MEMHNSMASTGYSPITNCGIDIDYSNTDYTVIGDSALPQHSQPETSNVDASQVQKRKRKRADTIKGKGSIPSPSPSVEIAIQIDENVAEKVKASKWWPYFNQPYLCPKKNYLCVNCKYCGSSIGVLSDKHGTSGLKKHVSKCKKIGAECPSQSKLNFSDKSTSNDPLWKHDDAKCREALCYMLVVDELPFRTVEKEGFKHFARTMNPHFKIPSRRTIGRDIHQMYLENKATVRSFIKENSQRVSITTDTWTSIQNVNYMCLTAHFIDNDWKLQKFILCFRPIGGHTGDDICDSLETCIKEWGIQKLFTITVDNATSNDRAIVELKKLVKDWEMSILGGELFHVRCAAHIMNLIVQDGVAEEKEAVDCIRGIVKHIRVSPSRYARFLGFVESENVESNKLLWLDVPTRWNSILFMLDRAITHERAITRYEANDENVKKALEKKKCAPPTIQHWKRAKMLQRFLQVFFTFTEVVSGSQYVTSHLLFHQICIVEKHMKDALCDTDSGLRVMARKMMEKYNKYWGSIDKTNKVLYYAVILDPRYKLDFLEFVIGVMLEEDEYKADLLKKSIREGFNNLFEEYKNVYENNETPTSSGKSTCNSIVGTLPGTGSRQENPFVSQFREAISQSNDAVKSELENYLLENLVHEKDGETFDILDWWKKNAPRFPILARIARDVLAIPITTVASESTFSTGRRILDPFRSSLLPKTVESLICLQNWIQGQHPVAYFEDESIEVDEIETELAMLSLD